MLHEEDDNRINNSQQQQAAGANCKKRSLKSLASPLSVILAITALDVDASLGFKLINSE